MEFRLELRDLVAQRFLHHRAGERKENRRVGRLHDDVRAEYVFDEVVRLNAIDNARTQLSYTRITAPLSGRTGFRLVDQGNIVHASDANGIVTIAQLQPISGIFTLPERYLPDVQRAMHAGPVKVWALEQDAVTEIAQGTLALIDNSVDPTTGTIRLNGLSRSTQIRIGEAQVLVN